MGPVKLFRAVIALAAVVAAISLVGLLLERRDEAVEARSYGPDRIQSLDELTDDCLATWEPVDALMAEERGGAALHNDEVAELRAKVMDLYDSCSSREMYFLEQELLLPWLRTPAPARS